MSKIIDEKRNYILIYLDVFYCYFKNILLLFYGIKIHSPHLKLIYNKNPFYQI